MSPLDSILTDSLRPAAPPAGLADRITAAAVSDFKVRRVRRRVLGTAAGISAVVVLTVVTWFTWPTSGNSVHRDVVSRQVIDPFRETNQRLTDAVKVEMPTLQLPESITIDLPDSSTDSVERFMTLPDRAKETVRPVSVPVTRAANRWAKEFGSAFGIPKPRM